jgi:Flp pilus assembly protein TadG
VTSQRRVRSRGRARRGQALVELALVAPFLLVLLLGSAQVGAIAYSQISIDTASREGARAGIIAPNESLGWDSTGTVGAQHQCGGSDYVDNPVCAGVLSSNGLLNANSFTSGQATVTITVLGAVGQNQLSDVERGPNARLMASSSCNPALATISGQVTGIPGGQSATFSDTGGDTAITTTGSFIFCASASGNNTSETFTASAPGTGTCGGYGGTYGPIAVSPGGAYTVSIAMTQNYATVSGTVSGAPAGNQVTVTDTSNDTKSGTADASGNFAFSNMCVVANGSVTNQTLTAESSGCGGYTGSSNAFVVTAGSSYTENFSVSKSTSATVTGIVSSPANANATVTVGDSTGDSTTGTLDINGNWAYTLCVGAGGSTTTQTITAYVTNAYCGGYSGTSGPFAVAQDGAYLENVSLSAEPACSGGGGGGGGSTPGCTELWSGEESDFISVTVTYPTPIFVPFIGGILQTSAGIRTIASTVTYAIDPCGMWI